MGEILDFKEEKQNKKLIDALTEYEKVMPTEEEIDANVNDFCERKQFDNDIESDDYYYRLKALLISTFDDLCEAFYSYAGDMISEKRLKKKLTDYDCASVLFDDYLDETYGTDYEVIADLDAFAESDTKYDDDSIEVLKDKIPLFIKQTKEYMNIIFRMIETKNKKCSSITMYAPVILNISYYPFVIYLKKAKSQT